MLKLLLLLAFIGGSTYAAIHFHVLKKPNLNLSAITSRISPPSSMTKSLDEISASTSGESKPAVTGKVAGITTEKLGDLGKAFSSLVTTGSDSAQVTIDVQKISDQIGAQMEKLPASIVNQAKVAYCQQVLIDATKSAEKK